MLLKRHELRLRTDKEGQWSKQLAQKSSRRYHCRLGSLKAVGADVRAPRHILHAGQVEIGAVHGLRPLPHIGHAHESHCDVAAQLRRFFSSDRGFAAQARRSMRSIAATSG